MLDRRQLVGAAALAAVSTAAAGTSAHAQATSPSYQVKPLPFDPKSIKGLSEKILVSHHDNNYAGAVKRLNAIATQWMTLDVANAPVFVINGLKREELMAMNSMILRTLFRQPGCGWTADRRAFRCHQP